MIHTFKINHAMLVEIGFFIDWLFHIRASATQIIAISTSLIRNLEDYF